MNITMHDSHSDINHRIAMGMMALESISDHYRKQPLIDWQPPAAVIVQGLADHFHVSAEVALGWIKSIEK